MHSFGGSGELGDDVPPASAGAAGVVREALALIDRAAGLLGEANLWALSDRESRDAVRSAYEGAARVESAKLALLADLDARPGAVAGARAPYVGQSFLTRGLSVGDAAAKRDVLAARALNRPEAGQPGDVPALPRMRDALAAGEVTRDHVDAAVKVWLKVPGHIAAAVDGDGVSGMQRIDAFLTDQSKQFQPKQVDRLGRELLATVAPEGDRFDPESVRRRFLHLGTDSTGMVVGRFQLDPVGGAALKAVIDHLSRPDQGGGVDESGQQSLVPDARSKGQRQADALVAAARLAMGADAGTARQEPPHVLVIADPDQVAAAQRAADVARSARAGGPGASFFPGAGETAAAETAAAGTAAARETAGAGVRTAGLAECAQTGALRPGVLGQMLCDCILQAVTLDAKGAVLNLGRTRRTASKDQRKALAARDRGCSRPGCTVPPAGCDAHHVTWCRNANKGIQRFRALPRDGAL